MPRTMSEATKAKIKATKELRKKEHAEMYGGRNLHPRDIPKLAPLKERKFLGESKTTIGPSVIKELAEANGFSQVSAEAIRKLAAYELFEIDEIIKQAYLSHSVTEKGHVKKKPPKRLMANMIHFNR